MSRARFFVVFKDPNVLLDSGGLASQGGKALLPVICKSNALTRWYGH